MRIRRRSTWSPWHRSDVSSRAVSTADAFALAVALIAYNIVTTTTPEPHAHYITRNVAASALLVGAARRRGFTWDELGLQHTDLRSAARWAGAATAITGGAVIAAVALGRSRSLGRTLLSDRRADVDDRALALQALVRIPVGTAAFEELAFRSVLYAVLRRSDGGLAALTGSSAAFGFWHVGPTLAALRLNGITEHRAGPVATSVAATTVAGLGFGLLRRYSGHVLPCWMAHWTSNAVGMLLARWWQRSAQDTTTA